MARLPTTVNNNNSNPLDQFRTVAEQWFLRIQGRQLALYLLGACCFFSILTAYHFDLSGGSNDIWDSIVFLPETTHASSILKLQELHDKDAYAKNDYAWDTVYEDRDDYRECTLNSAARASSIQHGCFTDAANTKMATCRVSDLQVHQELISGPPGGEAISDVMGREEDLELPQYHVGAFTTPHSLEFTTNSVEEEVHHLMNRDYWFYLTDVFMAMDMNQRKQHCSKVYPGISLVITRYEYVNLYHTMKDWWNAFLLLSTQSSPDSSLEEPDDVVTSVERVVFLDSHAQGQLDEVWSDLFGGSTVERIKQLPDESCLEHAWFVPSGYSSVLWPLGRVFPEGHRCPSMSHAFVQHVWKRYGVDQLQRRDDPINIVILHQPSQYLLHPRQSVSSTNKEEEQFWYDLQAKLLDDVEEASLVQIVDVHQMHFKAQLKLLKRAHVLIGYSASDHLTLGLLLPDNSTVIEVSDSDTSDDLSTMLQWRPSIRHKSVTQSLEMIIPEIRDVLTPGWDDKEPRYKDGFENNNNAWPDDEELYYNNTNNEVFPGNGVDDLVGWDGNNMFGEDNDVDENYVVTPADGLQGTGRGGGSLMSDSYDTATEYQFCSLYKNSFSLSNKFHGCHAGKNVPLCRFTNLQLHPDKIDFHSVKGGEFLDTVMGRNESLELPTYQEGAWCVSESYIELTDTSQLHYINDILGAMEVHKEDDDTSSSACRISEGDDTLTFLIQRYEYVDLFRTLNDWWNTFWSLPKKNTNTNNNNNKKIQIVFLDSHAQGFLDPVWNKVFGPTQYLAQYVAGTTSDETTTTTTTTTKCFQEATFIPSGYASPLIRADGYDIEACPAMTREFVNHFLQAYHVDTVEMDPLRITLVEAATDFITHPRQDPINAAKGPVSSFQLSSLQTQLQEQYPTLKLKIVQLEKMSFAEALKLLRQTHILLIDEGAASAAPMALFLPDGAHVIDLNSIVDNDIDNNNNYNNGGFWTWKQPHLTYRYDVFNQEDAQEDQVRTVLFPLLDYAIWNITSNVTTTTTIAAAKEDQDNANDDDIQNLIVNGVDSVKSEEEEEKEKEEEKKKDDDETSLLLAKTDDAILPSAAADV